MREKKGKVCKEILESKVKPLPPKQFVKFKYQAWSESTMEFAKKCLDVSSRASTCYNIVVF